MDEWRGSGEEEGLMQPAPTLIGDSDDAGAATIERLADGPVVAARFAAIASLLRACPHPGLVALVDASVDHASGRLVLHRVQGPDLAHARALTADEVAALGAALATTLADLHELGVTHGAIRAEHVLIDQGGRPILCGLGQARRRAPKDPEHRAAALDDTVALAAMLGELAGPQAGGLTRLLSRISESRGATGGSRVGGVPGCRTGCRRLAQQLATATPHPRLPEDPWPRPGLDARPEDAPPKGVQPAAHAGSHRRERRLMPRQGTFPGWALGPARGLLVAAAVALVAAGVWILTASWASIRHQRPVAAAALACPALDPSCGPLAQSNEDIDVGGHRFSIGRPGDIVVLGRWQCRGQATPALLRPATGDIWLFARWAGRDRPVTGHLLRRVPGASSLRVRPQGAGCDALVVLRRHTRPLQLEPGRRP